MPLQSRARRAVDGDSSDESSHMFGFSDDTDDDSSLVGRGNSSDIHHAKTESPRPPVNGPKDYRTGSDHESVALAEIHEIIPVALEIERGDEVCIRVDASDARDTDHHNPTEENRAILIHGQRFGFVCAAEDNGSD